MSWSSISFSENTATQKDYGSSFSAIGSADSGIGEKETWEGLVSENSEKNELVLVEANYDETTGLPTTVSSVK